MTPDNLSRLLEDGYNHIPVVREVFADLDTPLSCYIKVARGSFSYLLESAGQGGDKWSRYSVVGLPSTKILRVCGNNITVEENGEITKSIFSEDPLSYVDSFKQEYKYPELPNLPIYTGGLVGYFGYDTVRYVEKKLNSTNLNDSIGCPDILLMVSNDVIVFDSVEAKIHLITHVNGNGSLDEAQIRLDEMQEAMANLVPASVTKPGIDVPVEERDFKSSYGEQRYKEDVEKIKTYIVEGDVMQVVLSQRMSVDFETDPLHLYRALRRLNPSPYMYFMDLGDFQIVSSSPEILARLDGDEVTVRPLAGTRRRGVNAEEDLMLEEELLADPKERAEHLMLIDLGRNDIGRVCRPGTVQVSEMMIVERYAHVMHIASNVCGLIRENISAIDLLRATLPVGTLSGAPKVRAMEIIDELEPEKRGVFGGAVGYLSWNGNMDTAIAIRTAIIKNKKLYIQAGAGIVADSLSEREWEETLNKARSIVKASPLAKAGLHT